MTVTGERIGHQIAVKDKEYPIEYFTFFVGNIYMYSYSKLKVRQVRDDNQEIVFLFVCCKQIREKKTSPFPQTSREALK